MLKDYLQQCNEDVIVVENSDTLPSILKHNFSKVLLSPGPKTPAKSGCLMQVVNHCAMHKIPTLGVCLGHQAIGEYFGAQLINSKVPMHGKISAITHVNHPLFTDIPSPYEVCRYHSLAIEVAPLSDLEVIAKSATNEVMAIAHHSLPLWGVQFHPESIQTQFGKLLLQNWLLYCH